jgi:hypothetical protein
MESLHALAAVLGDARAPRRESPRHARMPAAAGEAEAARPAPLARGESMNLGAFRPRAS